MKKYYRYLMGLLISFLFCYNVFARDIAGTFVFKGNEDAVVEALNIFSSSVGFAAGSYFKWFRVSSAKINSGSTDASFAPNESPTEQGLTALSALDQYMSLAVSRHQKAVTNGAKNAVAFGWFGVLVGENEIQDISTELRDDSESSFGLLGLFIKMINPFSPMRIHELNPQSQLMQIASKRYDPRIQQSIYGALSKKMLDVSTSIKRFAGRWPVNQLSFDLRNQEHWQLLSEVALPIFAGGELYIGSRPSGSYTSVKVMLPALGMVSVNGSTIVMTPFVENVKSLGTSFFNIERISYGGLFAEKGNGSVMAAKFYKNFETPQKLYMEATFGDVVKADGFDMVNALSTNPEQALKIMVRPDFKFGSSSLLSALEQAGLYPKDALMVQMSFHKLAVDMERPETNLKERSKFSWTLNTKASLISYTICSRLGLVSMILTGLSEFQETGDTRECADMGVSGGGLRAFRLVGDDGRGISHFLNNVVLKNSFGKLQGNMESMFNQDVGLAIATAIQRGREIRQMISDELKKANNKK